MNGPEVIDDIARHFARLTPDGEAAIDGRRRLDYATLDLCVNGLAQWLIRNGVEQGDRVAVAAPPGLTYYVALLATARLGAIYVGINPRYTRDEVAHVVGLTEPVLCLIDTTSDGGLSPKIRAAVPALACHDLSLDALPEEGTPAIASRAKPDDVAVIVFTSGSTGRPKGAALHHGGLIAAARAQSALSDVWPDGAPPRYLCNLPTNHVGAIMNLTLAPLVAGGALIFQAKFDPVDTLELLAKECVTTWLQVPAMFNMCVQHDAFAGVALPDLRTIGIGGGPVSAKTLAALRRLGADIFVEYGQTETMSSLAWSGKADSDEVLLHTVGRFDPHIEARIADPTGAPVRQGEIGEVQARGNCTLRGYWNNPQATKEAFTPDGWLHTGDLAMQREDGRLVLVGRAREMIKSGGYNVYPREVEQVLEHHCEVAEVVVFGVPDEIFTERVEAAIEPRDSAHPPAVAELETLCREALAGYKLPRRFHLHHGLPRLPNGKVDRVGVKQAFK